MALLIKCEACNEEISIAAKECPKCGQSNEKFKLLLGVIIFVAVGILWVVFSDGGSVDNTLEELQEGFADLADDNIEKYELANKGNDVVMKCFHASVAAGLLLQAKDEERYLEWKEREKKDCR